LSGCRHVERILKCFGWNGGNVPDPLESFGRKTGQDWTTAGLVREARKADLRLAEESDLTNKAPIALAVFAQVVASPAVLLAQGAPDPDAEPLFVAVWMGGPLDSIYNAEYQRLQTACAGAGDVCYQTELDTTAVRMAPVFPSAEVGEPSGWLVARLRARGTEQYARLLFASAAGGIEVPLIDDVGDWGYGATLDLAEARDGWVRPWVFGSAGRHWLGPDGGPGLGVVEGPYGLEGRLWGLGPVVAARPGGGTELPGGVYMVLAVRDGMVSLRPELPEDMACGEPIDSTAPFPPTPVYEVPLARLLNASGRPEVQVAYGKGC